MVTILLLLLSLTIRALSLAPALPEPRETSAYTLPPVVAPAPTTTSLPCQEDEPCWDCTTMGNLICGPTADFPSDIGPILESTQE